MPAACSDSFPLTPLQQGMLYHWLQSPGSGADVEQMVCTLHEEIDPARLRGAWERAVVAYEALRLAFDWSGAEPVQRICAEAKLDWREKELGGEAALDAFLHDDRFELFDLNAAPLMRLTLIKVRPKEWRLVWTFHHLILDGRSIVQVLHRVLRDYDGEPVPVPEGSLRDFLPWHAALDHGGSQAFWQRHLAGVHGPSATVVEGLGKCSPAKRQAEADRCLSPETSTTLAVLAERAGITMNTLVQGAWALLISRYTGEESVVFGATRACRHAAGIDLQDVAGLLINTVPFHVEVEGGIRLIPWLQALRQTWTEMRDHERTPLPLIRRMAGLPGDQPLFNHLVVYEHEDFTAALRRREPGWNHREFDLRELTTVPLTLQVYGGEALRLHCAWDTSRFDREVINRMLGHAAHLLEQFAAAPDAHLDRYTLATAEECCGLMARGGSGCEVDSNVTLHRWFSRTAAAFPDRMAVTGSHGAWTYRELEDRSNAVAAALLAAGITRGDIVGLLVDRSGVLAAAILGILKAGAAYLPIDAAYPVERSAFMLADAGVRVLLTDAIMAGKVPPGSFRTLLCDDLSPAASAPDTGAHSPDDTAYIIYTSGSTGQPKGCMIPHRCVVRLMRATEPWFHFNETDVWTLFHSAAFDFSVWEIWGALLYGGRLCVVPWLTTRSPEDFTRLLCQEGVTILNQTPSAFRQLIAAEPLARGMDSALPPFALRKVIFGGEALEMHSLRPWFERHGDRQPQLVNMYGITETTVHVTWRPLSMDDLDRGSVIGEPIPDLQLYVLDPHTRQPAPVGIPGEMYVAGAGLATGYLNRPELTAERFPSNHLTGRGRLYKTGDLARLIPSGNGLDLEFLGRIDDQVKIRGFRIELGEIESVLCTHPRIREAAVLVREDRPGDKRLCAWIVSENAPDAAELREHLKARLPDYMIPAAFVPLKAFPLTTNGKLDRRALPAPVMENANRTFVAPAGEVESTLASIWQKILRVERVGTGDNFFELGGDSILSIQVIARAREAGLHLTPRQLFENPTVAALAKLTADKPAVTKTVAEVSGVFRPSPIQQWFLEQELEGSNHWNQTFLFTVSERLETGALAAALPALVAHHSALRLRFVRRNNMWEQSVHPEADGDILTLHDFAGYTDERLTRQIERACRVEQARLSFEFGPLLRAAYMDCGEDRPGRLLLTVHHLAVDGVSWRMLLEDLEKGYRQAADGKPVSLTPGTHPFSAWACQVRSWAIGAAAAQERAFWAGMIERSQDAVTLHEDGNGFGSNTEAESYVVRTRLSRAGTEALLQKVPAVLRTRINDALLTALARAVYAVTGGARMALQVEGHGRESHIGGDLDVSRTVGWFTAIYPVCLDLPETADTGDQVRSIQRQLSEIPGNGSGFSALGIKHQTAILFNYLGRMDSITEGSGLFTFARESTGPWHSQSAERKYQIEINAMVIGGELEVAWTACLHLHKEEVIQTFAQGFHDALLDIITQCSVAGAVVDTSLSGLDGESLARLMKDQQGIVEVSALTPMQQLFYSAGLTKPGAGYDQWHGRLRGPLDSPRLQQAWSEVFARHSILRSSFHSAGLPHPVQVVRESASPEWQLFDLPEARQEEVIARVLAEDAAQRNDLTKAVLSRFTLIRFSDTDHFLLWSLPDLHLDGWSWPIVFSEVNEVYQALTEDRAPSLPPALPYRTWIEWLQARETEPSLTFWKKELEGVTEPTALPVDLITGPKAARKFGTARITFDGAAIVAAARRLSISPGALVQAAWALLLARGAGEGDIVFGTAFSGRPPELPGADRIVGPFVNNLPVRLKITGDQSASSLLHALQSRLIDISEHQYTPVTAVQDCTAIPWQSRVFNSLAVFQNYEVGAAAKHFGPAGIEDFTGPVHTNYTLTMVVTPGETWDASLLYHEAACSPDRAALLTRDFVGLLSRIAAEPDSSCAALMRGCALPGGSGRRMVAAPLRKSGGAAPRTRMEKSLAVLWQRAFGLADLSTDDNFFDLGGGSLLMVRLHAAMREELGREVPLVDLFRFPTIGAMARHLDPAATVATSAVQVVDQTQSRAAAARAAAAKARDLRTR